MSLHELFEQSITMLIGLQQKSLLLILCGMELCDWLIDFQGIPQAGALTIGITVLRINSCTAE